MFGYGEAREGVDGLDEGVSAGRVDVVELLLLLLGDVS